MTVCVVLAIAALSLWGFGLWSRGFFSSRTSPLERRVYAVRVAAWLGSILIVAWPLQLYRKAIGDVAYVVIAIAILAVCFGLGILATRLIVRRYGERQ